MMEYRKMVTRWVKLLRRAAAMFLSIVLLCNTVPFETIASGESQAAVQKDMVMHTVELVEEVAEVGEETDAPVPAATSSAEPEKAPQATDIPTPLPEETVAVQIDETPEATSVQLTIEPTPVVTPDERSALQRAIEDEGGAYVSVRGAKLYEAANLATLLGEASNGILFAVGYTDNAPAESAVRVVLHTGGERLVEGYVAQSRVSLLPRDVTASAMIQNGEDFFLDQERTIPLQKIAYNTHVDEPEHPAETEAVEQPTETPPAIVFEDVALEGLPEGITLFQQSEGFAVYVYRNQTDEQEAFARYGFPAEGRTGFYACSQDGTLLEPLVPLALPLVEVATVAFEQSEPLRLPKGYEALPVLPNDIQLYTFEDEYANVCFVRFGTPQDGVLGYYASNEQGTLSTPLSMVRLPLAPFTYLPLDKSVLPEDVREKIGDIEEAVAVPVQRLLGRSAAIQAVPFDEDGDGRHETQVVAGSFNGISGLYEADAQGAVADSPVLLVWLRAPLSYAAGALSISTQGALPSSATAYRLSDDILTKVFTVKYTVANGKSTLRTVLVVNTLAYGTQWASNLVPSAAIAQAVKLDDRTYAILLADGLTGDVTIDFGVSFQALTQTQAENWVDKGTLPATNITAREYQMGLGSSLADILTDGGNVLYTTADYFTQDITLENTTANTMTPMHTYRLSISSVPQITDIMMSQDGAGSARDQDAAYYGPIKDPNVMLSIPTVHTGEMPLVEIKHLKVYVPDERLALTGVSNNPSIYKQTNEVINSEYYQIWNDWDIGARQFDGAANRSYYLITPKGGNRVFNNGTTQRQGELTYGMRLLWALVNQAQPLDASASDYTVYQAPDSVMEVYIPSGTPTASEKPMSFTGPKVETWLRQDTLPKQAYNASRRENNTPNNNVVPGAVKMNEAFSYLSNQWYRAVVGGKVVEFIPQSTGSVTQSYTFPYEIQPFNISFSDQNQKNVGDKIIGTRTKMNSLTYTTLDGMSHTASASDIADINDYYAGVTATEGKVTFAAATASNRVIKVAIVWDNVLTEYGYGYPSGINAPITNNLANNTLAGSTAAIVTKMSYNVMTTDESLLPLGTGSSAQSKYIADFSKPSLTDFASDPEFLWWKFIVQPCPEVWSEMTTGAKDTAYYADGNSEYSAGHIYFNIGTYGERQDDLENPAMELFTRFNNAGHSVGINNNLTQITEAEGIAFLTGGFTAMPKLSGWVFEYDTNMAAGQSWTVPTVVNPAGENVQIPLQAGEYFTRLSMRYAGTFSTAHESPTDIKTQIYMMKNIKMRAMNTNPNNNALLNTQSPFQSAFVQLHGYAHWDNCSDATHDHDTAYGPGQLIKCATTVYGALPPQMGIWFTRQAELKQTETVALPSSIQQIYQGDAYTDDLRFTLVGYAPNTPEKQYNPFGAFVTIPWSVDVNEAVYVELTDSELVPDLDSCSLYGVPVSSGNVEASIVAAGGKTYAKLQFRAGFQRSQVLNIPYSGNYKANFSNDLYTGYSQTYNAAGIVKMSFIVLPGATLGRHYPIGGVYLDFTDLLEQYDAPNTTGYDLNRTNWAIKGNADDALLANPAVADTDVLFRYDLSQSSATPYAVDVIRASTAGANLYPGKNGVSYDFVTRVTEFVHGERETLNAMYSFLAPQTKAVYEATGYISIPRKNVAVGYLDSGNMPQSVTSQYDMHLRGAPVVITDTTAIPGNIEIAYTTDPNPSDASSYTTIAPSTQAGWMLVTGIRVTVGQMPQQSAVNVRLDLTAQDKGAIGTMNAYSSGPYKYKDTPSSAFEEMHLPLATWRFTDYVAVNAGKIFWDTYDEDGLRSPVVAQQENWVAGIVVKLLDTDGSTVIDSTSTGLNGEFTLMSHKDTAGQIIKIEMPTDPQTTVKPTARSTSPITTSGIDSDFDRNLHTLVLPQLTASGFQNVSAGLVRLPLIAISDQTFTMGQTVTPYQATLTEFFGNPALPVSPTYRLQYSVPADTSIVSFPALVDTTNAATITPTLHKPGTTTATVKVVNNLGDEVIVTYNITVVTRKLDWTATKIWSDNDNNRGTRPATIQLQLQRMPKVGTLNQTENVNTPVTVSASSIPSWQHVFGNQPEYSEDGVKYTYSVVESGVDTDDYSVAYNSDQNARTLTVTNTAKEPLLGITKTTLQSAVRAGEDIVYTITVTNTGAGKAKNVEIKEALPANATLKSTVASSGSYNAGISTWSIPALATGASATLTLTVTVSANAQDGDNVINTVTIQKESGIPPTQGTLSDSVTTPVRMPKLAISKTTTQTHVRAGEDIVYTITVSNSGSAQANGLKVTETLPSNTTYKSHTASVGSYSSVTGLWTLGNLSTGASATLTITLTASATAVDGDYVTNKVAVTEENGIAPPAGTLEASTQTPVKNPHMSIAKTVDKAEVRANDLLTYTIRVNNTGEGVAKQIVVTETLPANATYQSHSVTRGTFSQITGLWTAGDLGKGEFAELVIIMKVSASAIDGQMVNNAVGITQEDGNTPTQSGLNDSTSTPVRNPYLSIAKTADVSQVRTGEAFTYTIVVSNTGLGIASNVLVQETLPANAIYAQHTASQGAYQTASGLWTVGNIPAGGSATLTLKMRASTAVRSGDSIVNTVVITKENDETPTQGTLQDTVTTPVRNPVLVVNKTVDKAQARTGDQLDYTITVTNSGLVTALNVKVNDMLPAHVTLLGSATMSGTFTPATGMWSLGNLTPGQSVQLVLQVLILPSAPDASTLTNHVSIIEENGAAPVEGTFNDSADTLVRTTRLAITKVVDKAQAQAGEKLVYTITITNSGSIAASNIVVQEVLPTNATYAAHSVTAGTYATATHTWTIASLAIGQTQTLTLEVNIDANAADGSTVLNQVDIVQENGQIPGSGVLHAQAETDVAGTNLSIAKTVDKAITAAGEELTYSITVTNHGPGLARAVSVAETLPRNAKLISAEPSAGTYNKKAGIWYISEIAVGQSVQMTVVVRVSASAVDDDTVVNHVKVVSVNGVSPHEAIEAVAESVVKNLHLKMGYVLRNVGDCFE